MKSCCTKMKKWRKVSMFLPMILTFLATQHWLHGLIFIALGGTASELMSMSMDSMLPFQRVMIVLTLVTVLWSVYELLKDRFIHKAKIALTSISALIGLGYVIAALIHNGW
ncbi:hypothetical protein [Ammoniphilus resinae]|uniref:Membrane protein n=1 Tax=Ammoniphilus resinae TaxID=861532 RepID=A0ABS4GW32_9BACL|nr:hypothetical protein [Ammoniphilus resinae]MBP1934490.1 putative membrane protein [Ammoniphilus resinae]